MACALLKFILSTGGGSAPIWSLFGGDREKTKEYNDKMKNGILFAMIISILDIFIKTPLHGGFCSIKLF